MVSEEENVAGLLRANTLRVYWYLLKSPDDTIGVRETQRALGFSSPALALYHPDKFVDLGLVEKKQGEYRLLKKVDVGIIRQLLRLGTLWYETFRIWRRRHWLFSFLNRLFKTTELNLAFPVV